MPARPNQRALTRGRELSPARSTSRCCARPPAPPPAARSARSTSRASPLGDAPFVSRGRPRRRPPPASPCRSRSATPSRGWRSSAEAAPAPSPCSTTAPSAAASASSPAPPPTPPSRCSPRPIPSPRALSPFAEIREPRAGSTDPIGELLAQNLSVLVLADIGALDRDTAAKISTFIELVAACCCASPARALAAAIDDLTPVQAASRRPHARRRPVLGDAAQARALHPREPVLRRAPDQRRCPRHPARSWRSRRLISRVRPGPRWRTARRSSAGERRGDGVIAMMPCHRRYDLVEPAALRLFVEMLRKVVGARRHRAAGSASRGCTGGYALADQGPRRQGPSSARRRPRPEPVARSFTGRATLGASARHLWPGRWLARSQCAQPHRHAEGARPRQPRRADPAGRPRRSPRISGRNSWCSPCCCSLPTRCATLWLGGRLRLARSSRARRQATPVFGLRWAWSRPRGRRASSGAVAAGSGRRARIPARRSRASFSPPAPVTRPRLCRHRRQGRSTTCRRPGSPVSNIVLGARTALEPGEAVGVDVARDELAFFLILYWPVVRRPAAPSAPAAPAQARSLYEGRRPRDLRHARRHERPRRRRHDARGRPAQAHARRRSTFRSWSRSRATTS